MRYNLTSEQEKLNAIVLPYRRAFFNPFRVGIDSDAPEEVKAAYAKLKKITEEQNRIHNDY